MEEKHNSPATATDAAQPSSAELPSSRRRGGGLKRKASNLSNSNTSTPPPSSSSKRQTREKPSPVLFPPIHNGPLTRARLQPNYTDSTTFWDAVIVNDEGDRTPGAAKAEEELIARKQAWEALEAKIEAEYDELKSRDANAHVVPIASGWFSWTKVHQLEEKALPSFFNKKLENRTPEIYMEIRNSIMKRFHSNPNSQIEEKDLSEIPVGESDAKKEVMEFLDYWGLINYHPFPETDVAISTVDPEEAEKVNSLIQKLYEFEVEQLKVNSPAAPRSSFPPLAVPSRLPESMITDESVQPEGPSVEYHCNSCAADCSRKRYHCQKQADFDLCSECFNAGKFDSDMSPSDFILMEPGDAAGASSGKWTDQETLLLLEALELFSENWNEIAEHVATKTKAQCILHFLQMPIEDAFRDRDDEDEDKHENEDESQLKEKTEKKDKDENKVDEKKEVNESQEENVEKIEVDVNMKEKTDDKDDDTSNTKETEDSKAIVDGDDAKTNTKQVESVSMDISETVDATKVKDDEEKGVNIAVKALKEAFEAVGFLPSADDKFSFVDAGNPVMAMAAFLTRLVEPNIVTASTHASLKSVANGGTGLRLAARHSFVLEDPIDEEKRPDETERDVEESLEKDGSKEKTDSDKKQEDGKKEEKEEKEKSKLNDENDKEGTIVAVKEKELLLPVSNEKKEEAVKPVSKKGKNGGTRRKGSSGNSKKDKDAVVVKEKPVIAEESNEKTQEVENNNNSKKESEDAAAEEVPPQPLETSKDASKEALKEASKDEEMVEAPQSNNDTSMPEKAPNSGEAGTKDSENVKKDVVLDPIMDNLKRAAVTAISAAAVKAKFLADQEEDSIRQLATSLIEKQLHKLETKLAFFTEMDGVVARAREQLERSKQRLYHERAQIIAARLGMSNANSGRPMTNPNASQQQQQRPPNPMGMTPQQRPPLSRPMMGPTPTPAPTPPFPNQIVPPGMVGGNANNQEKLSSVGMK